MPAEPFSITATLTLPPDTGQPNETLSYSASGTFSSATQQKLELVGTGTHAVNFGTMAGGTPRIVWLEHEKLTGPPQPPIRVSLNGGTPLAIPAGGFLACANPLDTVFSTNIISISIAFSASCTVRVALLG
jgi:hypothetical protein